MKTKTPYYINGIGILSPQRTFDHSEFLSNVTTHVGITLPCQVPDFKVYINPLQLRRLSHMLRIGLSAAIICFRDSGNTNPDGIITATGYGSLNETEKFLVEILEQQEKHLTPTFFMQSTYNALSGLVALALKCNGYNNTHVNKAFAFETALLDAMMQLNEAGSETFLVGAYDEADETQFLIKSRIGYYKTEPIHNLELFQQVTPGSLQGEGAAFFSISGIRTGNWCTLKDVKMIFMPGSAEELVNELHLFLDANQLPAGQVDVLISGVSGDLAHDRLLTALTEKEFPLIPQVRFKHLCGEYCTASSFGLWLGASMLRKQEIPTVVKFNQAAQNPRLRTVLLVNQFMGRNYSFILLTLDS